MTNSSESSPPVFPFVIGDLVLIAFAYVAMMMGSDAAETGSSLPHLIVALCALVGGAVLSCWPFVLRHRAAVARAETASVADAVQKLSTMEELARSVAETTSRWQEAQDAADRTTASAREIAEGMAAERASFKEFLAQANDTERRLTAVELDKLRRGQAESVQVIIALLDNVNALHSAAVRSGQQKVIEQLTRFRAVSLDIVRRLGLVATGPNAGDAFDAEAHVLVDGQKAAEGATIVAVIQPGFSFQGQPIRRPLVSLEAEPSPKASSPTPEPETQRALL